MQYPLKALKFYNWKRIKILSLSLSFSECFYLYLRKVIASKSPFWCATSHMIVSLAYVLCIIQAFYNLLLIQEASGNRLVSSCCYGTERPLWIWNKIQVKKPFLIPMLNSKRNTLGTKSSLAVFKTSRVQISNNCE